MLLKTIWRHAPRNGNLLSKALRDYTASTELQIAPKPRSTDTVMTRIKDSPNPADVLTTVQQCMPHLTYKHMLLAFRCLFDLQKSGKSKEAPEMIIKDPTFITLCQNFKKHARELEVNESIEAIKVLSYLGAPVDSLLVQTLLQTLRCNINQLNTRQIMFLDFVLSRFDTKNHLVDALSLALPLAFQIQLPNEVDNDVNLLKDMLAFACHKNLPDRSINNIVTGLLLNDQDITPEIAKKMLYSLCLINCTEEVYPTRSQLLHICCDILTANVNKLSYEDILRISAKIKGRILDRHPEYYHEGLLDAIGNYVVDNQLSFDKALVMARVLSRVAHTHLGLTEYLCQLAVADKDSLTQPRPNILFSFVNCLSNNNYIPVADKWKVIVEQISNNPLLDASNTMALPLPKICLELASLGYYEDRALSKVFSPKYLEDLFSGEPSKLDYLQLFTLHEAIQTFHGGKYQLPRHILEEAKAVYPTNVLTNQVEAGLARGLGGKEYVVKNVVLPNGIIADCLTCLQRGYPVQLPDCRDKARVPIQELDLPSDSLVVCILNFHQGCYSMNSNRLRGTFRLLLDILEKQGYIAVPLNTTEWLACPELERIQYLTREVGYKCGEVGVKLSAMT